MRIANQEWQITSIAQTVELSMTHRGDAHLILNRKSIPKDFWEFPCKDYEDTYMHGIRTVLVTGLGA